MSNSLPTPEPLRLIRDYLDAIEQDAGEEQLSQFFVPDVEQREFPNRLVEHGAVRGLPELLEGRRKGRKVLRREHYVVKNALVDGARVAVELEWAGELAVPFGNLAAGDMLRATCGVFFRIRDGRIAEQHNFDCFEPF